MLRRIRTKLLVSICAAAAIGLAGAAVAAADTYTVNDPGDAGDASVGDGICDASAGPGLEAACTLRAAIDEANFAPEQDDVAFAPGLAPIVLATPVPILAPVRVDGNGSGGSGATVIDGEDLTGLLVISSSADPLTTISDLRLEDGAATGDAGGAGIRTDANTALDDVVLSSNQLGDLTADGHGAAVFNSSSAATLTITASAITGNTITSAPGFGASGAGVASAGPLALTDSTVSGNTIVDGGGSGAQGGGIRADGALAVLRSTVSGNSVAGLGAEGAGIFNGADSGARSIVNSTISGNTAPDTGGGGVQLGADAQITHVTFAANAGGSGGLGADLLAYAGTATAKNTIFGSATGCAAVGRGNIASAAPGNNIDAGTSCGFGTANGNQQDTDPLLASLALNAPGLTETHALLPASPALDAATQDCGGLISDQRGFARSQGGAICDVGAYEAQHRLLTATRTGLGSGSVTGLGIACGADCTQSYVQGASVVLTATPAAGSEFAGWSGCDTTAGQLCTVAMGSDRMVAASFALTPPPVQPPSTGGGAVTQPPVARKCRKGSKRIAGKCRRIKKKPA